MAEPIVDFEHGGKTYTLMKFVQVSYSYADGQTDGRVLSWID